LAGVSVLDKESGMTTTTDARGFYRLRIPVAKDSMTVRMEYSKQGYSSDWSGHFLPAIGHSVGLIDIGLLISKGDSAHFMMKPPYFKRVPEDPSYADAVDALGDVFQEVLDMNRFSEMRTVHPEVALFYTTEDKEHQVVILANGEVEKYGYPGGPAVAEMEKKYGRLPEMMTPKTAMAGKGYLSEWARIAGEAEKQFHPSGSNARHIIFPGDSRVIAVPVSGKPEVYDMDNNNSRERPAFEKLYGKLPDCVPSPAFSLPAAPATHAFSGPASFRPARVAAALRATDTVPKKADSAGKDASGSVTPIQMRLKGIPDNVLYVVNDVVMPDGWTFDTIPPEKIFSINILKDKAAVSVFGDRAVNGVIEITTKGYHGEFSRLHPIDPNDALHQPLYIVDGKVAGPGVFKNVDPDRILSIEILKDKKALDTYGESGKNGIVLVHTKDGKGPEPVMAKPSSIPGGLYPGGEHI
jgi:TonB-dependent SusC/RagA subfamily outer membrane receptor